eukprot:12573301-Alexandrium_andersonii.AAC.1
MRAPTSPDAGFVRVPPCSTAPDEFLEILSRIKGIGACFAARSLAEENPPLRPAWSAGPPG